MISLDEYNQTHNKLKKDAKKAILEVKKGDFIAIDEAFELAKNSYRN